MKTTYILSVANTMFAAPPNKIELDPDTYKVGDTLEETEVLQHRALLYNIAEVDKEHLKIVSAKDPDAYWYYKSTH
jgi:hypothetical protein